MNTIVCQTAAITGIIDGLQAYVDDPRIAMDPLHSERCGIAQDLLAATAAAINHCDTYDSLSVAKNLTHSAYKRLLAHIAALEARTVFPENTLPPTVSPDPETPRPGAATPPPETSP